MTEKYCGSFKCVSERDLTKDETLRLRQLRKRSLAKTWLGVGLFFLSIPVTMVLGFWVNKLFDMNDTGAFIILLGMLAGLPAGVLIFKDNFTLYRKIRKASGRMEIYRGLVDEFSPILFAEVSDLLGEEGREATIELFGNTPLVCSVNGIVVQKVQLVTSQEIASPDVAYTVSLDSEMFGSPSGVEFEKRHMSEDEMEEVRRIIQKNRQYWSLARAIGLFFSLILGAGLYIQGPKAFYREQGLYPSLVMIFLVFIPMLIDTGTYIYNQWINWQLYQDLELGEVWIINDATDGLPILREEALPHSKLTWTRNGQPLPWRFQR